MDKFTQAYLVCALWSSNDESNEQGGEPLDTNYSLDDCSQELIDRAIRDCTMFQACNARDLVNENMEQAGHDFWLTRNGHGSGFWDGDYEKAKGERLTRSSEQFGEISIYVGDDNRLYFQ